MLKVTTLLVFLFIDFFSLAVRADSIIEEFNSITNKGTSTAVWNQELGVVHPTMYVDYKPLVATQASKDISVGDGRHGAFDSSIPSTYTTFATLINSTDISINTANTDYDELNFTSFKLDAGHKLTRSDGHPIIIRSLSTVLVNGIIDCSGDNGNDATGAIGGSGGAPRCDGKSGGSGGNSGVIGSLGASGNILTGSSVTGGGAGNVSPTVGKNGGGGGGGGSYSVNCGAPGFTEPGGGNGGAAGTCQVNNIFTVIDGSAGGGGGGGSHVTDNGGGGGGGAGGGTIIIHAVNDVTISNTGAINVKAGNGGNGVNFGGNGGGGGGGSVSVFSANNINLALPNYPIDNFEGNDLIAGEGGEGLSWDAAWDATLGFPLGGSERYGSLLFEAGIIKYNTNLQTIISRSFNTSSDLTTYSSITAALASGLSSDINLFLAGSTDNFATNDTGWKNNSQLSVLDNHRYVKFKIELTNTNQTTPTKIESITINYNPNTPPPPAPVPAPSPSPTPTPTPSPSPSPGTSTTALKQDFQFNSGACGTVSNQALPQRKYFMLLSLILLIPIFTALRLRSKTVYAKKKN